MYGIYNAPSATGKAVISMSGNAISPADCHGGVLVNAPFATQPTLVSRTTCIHSIIP